MLPKSIKGIEPDVFYHLAWDGAYGKKAAQLDLQLSNISWASDAVEAASGSGCKRFVFGASVMQYALTQLRDLEPTPRGVYYSAKQTASVFSRFIAHTLGIDFLEATITNVYGPGTNQGLIHETIAGIINEQKLRFSKGEQLYDFIYIDDAAEEIRLLGESGKAFASYYIGSAEQRTLRDYISTIFAVCKAKHAPHFGSLQSSGGIDMGSFEINRLSNETGYIPRVPFEDGILRTYDWLYDVEGR
jgi:nucleoside-diphosphate-sugar epimerase